MGGTGRMEQNGHDGPLGHVVRAQVNAVRLLARVVWQQVYSARVLVRIVTEQVYAVS